MTDNEIIYIGDPMCSWCYGFTNVIQMIKERYTDRARVTLMLGGLRPDGTHLVDDQYSKFLKTHWQEIGQRTGQMFDLSILDNLGWVYDTEKPCRAVVAVRRLQPDLVWEYFAATQKGFYFNNHNPNDPRSFARIAATFGIDEDSFLQTFHDQATIDATQNDFRAARKMGVNSFPTVLLRKGQTISLLTMGYRPVEALIPALETWLND